MSPEELDEQLQRIEERRLELEREERERKIASIRANRHRLVIVGFAAAAVAVIAVVVGLIGNTMSNVRTFDRNCHALGGVRANIDHHDRCVKYLDR